MNALIFAVTVAGLLAGCADTPPAVAPPAAGPLPAPTASRAPEVAPDTLSEQDRAAIPFDAVFSGEEEALAELGPVRERSARPFANRWTEGQMDSLVTRVYDGVTVSTYHVATGKVLVSSVDLTATGYRTHDGLAVGASRSEVEQALGRPVRQSDGASVYEVGDPMPTIIEVTYAEGGASRARRIVWHPPID